MLIRSDYQEKMESRDNETSRVQQKKHTLIAICKVNSFYRQIILSSSELF